MRGEFLEIPPHPLACARDLSPLGEANKRESALLIRNERQIEPVFVFSEMVPTSPENSLLNIEFLNIGESTP